MENMFMRCFFVCLLFTALYMPTQAQQRKPAAPAKEEKEQDFIFAKVDPGAGFRDGEAAWRKFLQKNIHYPQMADDFTGSLKVQFIVYPTGKAGDVQILNNTDTAWASEIKRVFALSDGMWRPAIQCGRLVKAYKTISIDISLR
jgi:protein TonB